MSRHKRQQQKPKFCSVRGTPCSPCGNNYRTNCQTSWPYQAHHVLCVSSVSGEIQSKSSIRSVVGATNWCVNKKSNMLAMPMWGSTVKHYCRITKIGGGILKRVPRAPKFKNIPQHDWDHNGGGSYREEVNKALKDLVAEIKEAGHEYKPKDLVGALNGQSQSFRSKLKARGARNGGTHASWKSGAKNRNWCQPFSMASTALLKEFPVRDFDDMVAKWIDRLSAAMR